jgi:hypothetical protein
MSILSIMRSGTRTTVIQFERVRVNVMRFPRHYGRFTPRVRRNDGDGIRIWLWRTTIAIGPR